MPVDGGGTVVGSIALLLPILLESELFGYEEEPSPG